MDASQISKIPDVAHETGCCWLPSQKLTLNRSREELQPQCHNSKSNVRVCLFSKRDCDENAPSTKNNGFSKQFVLAKLPSKGKLISPSAQKCRICGKISQRRNIQQRTDLKHACKTKCTNESRK